MYLLLGTLDWTARQARLADLRSTTLRLIAGNPCRQATTREIHALLAREGFALTLLEVYYLFDHLADEGLVCLSGLTTSDLLDTMVDAGHLPVSSVAADHRPQEAFLTPSGEAAGRTPTAVSARADFRPRAFHAVPGVVAGFVILPIPPPGRAYRLIGDDTFIRRDEAEFDGLGLA